MKRPTRLKVMEARASAVTLQWACASPEAEHFLIEWSRDGKGFSPSDEIDRDDAGSRDAEGRFTYIDPNPASGVSWYRVAAFRNDGTRLIESARSRAVSVKIVGPASGDVAEESAARGTRR